MSERTPARELAADALLDGRYRIVEELGKGGAAIVYRVVDTTDGRELALKRRSERRDSLEARRVALFRHEYHTLTQLKHPGIVEVLDYGVADGRAYYTMELIDGKDVCESAPLPPREACSLLRDVASSLAMLHARRLLHRDVSYRNVRCTPEGRAKLIDFGAMMTAGSSTEVIGTPPFLPPEALDRRRLDQRSDLYSLGALAYWMLTGRHAYPAGSAHVLRHLWAAVTPPAPSSVAPDIPADLDRLVMSLLSLEPDRRPSSAAEVMERLSVIGQLPPAEDLRVADAYLATPTLVGRQRQLARLRNRIQDRDAREAFLIEGAEGVGKSRLLEEVLIEAKLDGALAVRVVGERAGATPYGVMRQIVAALTAGLNDPARGLSETERAALSTEFPALEAAEHVHADVPAGELRHRLQDALVRWLGELANGRRIVLLVDDFVFVDEESAAVLASLAAGQVSGDLRLIAAMPPPHPAEAPVMRLLRKAGQRIRLDELDEGDTAKLVASLFGEGPNLSRLSHWMYERTHGNPLACSELAQYLVEREIIRYTQGTWVIPTALPAAVPVGLLATRRARIDALPASQHAVAEALSIFDNGAPLELCGPVAGVDAYDTFEALDTLMRLELVDLKGEAYAFCVEALRLAVAESIAAQRRAEMHERAGRLLSEWTPQDLTLRLRAAHHLMRGQSRNEGAERVAAMAADATIGRDVGDECTAALELALQLLEAEKRPHAETIPIRHRLLNAAFLYDRTLVRHAEPLLPQLKHDAGMDLMDEVELGSPTSMQTMLERARARYEATPVADRGLAPQRALETIAAISGITLAAAILNWDIALIERVWELARPLAALGHDNALAAVPELVGLYVGGLRVGESSEHEARLAYIERLRDPARYVGLPAERRESVLSTQLHNVGMATAVLDGETALRLADEIDALGMQMYAGAALQVRYLVHMYRGEATRAREFREKLDLFALRGGAGVQFELWLAPYLADPYALWGDVIGLKHAWAHLEHLAEGFEGYAPMALIAEGHYHRERGHYSAALEAFERARELAPRDRHGAWLLALSGHVDTLVAAGEHGRAVELAEQVLGGLRYRERFNALIRRRLAPSLALARAHLGQIDAAVASVALEISAESEQGKSPLLLGRLHEVGAQIAILQGAKATFSEHVERVGELFRSTENPVLIARHERLVADGERSFLPSRRPCDQLPASATPRSYLELVRSSLERLPDSMSRANDALSLLERDAGATLGFLYLQHQGDLQLAAPLGERPPPRGLGTLVSEFMQSYLEDSGATCSLTCTMGPEPGTTTLIFGNQSFVPVVLSSFVEGRTVVVGVAVIPAALQAPQLPTPQLVRAVAQTLCELGEVVL